ncbi:MAG TPA: 2Fe-2S iron-sulfur cluster-binding protein [Gemmatimonadaceae bacterium]|nr:2Fe-2S iron-sulfur cluster-binding protein [Gemmatimonadaceae bacterium]
MSARLAPAADSITLHANGRAVRASAGVSVAAALLDAGIVGFRSSVSGEARAPLCGMGTCYECRVTIDGIMHRRACLVPVSDGMRIETSPRDTGAVP